MPDKNLNVHELLSRLRQYFQEASPSRKYANEPPPLRAELYNTVHMEQHGRSLAKAHKVSIGRSRDLLLKRLAENENILLDVRNLLADAMKDKHLVTPGGEWILDNFYLIEEHIRTGKRHFPKGYSEGLPKLVSGHSEGLPRVYDIAVEIISHSDGRIDLESLGSFIRAYQEVNTLQLGELWAIPIMLRLALIENLRRVSVRIALDRVNQNLADYWSDQMIETAEKDPKSLILVIADMARSGPPMESSFVAELTRQLMWKGPALTLQLTWMEQRLAETGITSTELVNIENQKQAADQVSISNSIGSLRFINSLEWRKFVESMSKVEEVLRRDPAGIYPAMDFSTRDHYRHVVERVAKYSKLSETNVADLVVTLAEKNIESRGKESRASHIGYYLVDKGLATTEQKANVDWPLSLSLKKKLAGSATGIYIGGIILLTCFFTSLMLWHEWGLGLQPYKLVIAGALSLIAVSQLMVALVNWLVTLVVRPTLLSRLDFSEGVPEGCKTLVIVPTLLTSPTGVVSLVEALEIRFLANRMDNLYYGLLTDLADAKEQEQPADAELVALAVKEIKALNEKYSTGKDIFFLFHRPRLWNAADKVWMGYERKRGKLSDLNNLLLHGETDKFSMISGDISLLRDTRYVITLDTDTQLPRDAGWKMVATMAHPLNKPCYDEKKKRVTEGYGLLQPRMGITLPRSSGTLYNRMHANDAGIDPYTRLTSDVYQDLFGEGSFIGKGIYEVETFERTLHDRFPDNRILSHDLLEGSYIRAGLQSDVQLYEEYPSQYAADVSRRHRWIRGDWQIGWWFLPVVPDANRKFIKNPLSALSRWKIFDNIRRSLVPVSLMLLLLLGWTMLRSSGFWTLMIVFIVTVPSIISWLWNIAKRPKELNYRQHFLVITENLVLSLVQNVYTLVCMPFEAYYHIDAIIRTSWRMLVSRRHLLEWKPSNSVDTASTRTIKSAFMTMWISPFISLVTIVCVIICYPLALISAFPLLAAWAIAPLFVWWTSAAPEKEASQISPSQRMFLRRTARKTWGFFEQFVNAEDNWLPPDNHQEQPREANAHRTSPTNIGLSLLANLAAYDFGYVPATTVVERTSNTIATLDKMERYRDHFYNWYDTRTLAPLNPRYISTVDSGNLAGHLLTMRQGLLALANSPVISAKFIDGLRDTVGILEEYMKGSPQVRKLRDYLNSALAAPPATLEAMKFVLDKLVQDSAELHNTPTLDADAAWWSKSFADQCRRLSDELTKLTPWVNLMPYPAGIANLVSLSSVPTLNELTEIDDLVIAEINKLQKEDPALRQDVSLEAFKTAVSKAAANATDLVETLYALAEKCDMYADMEYEFLYDKSKQLLVIGYNVDDNRLDVGSYDLLASEARLCTFVAVAQGKLPQDSWFALGRLLTSAGTTPLLLSWSGSMFEYLMPNLVMPDYEGTIIYQTNKAVIERQIEYGAQRGVPWGISESGYNMVDANLNYQYRAFGVPGLGLKRGLSDDLVIAPYATVMSLMISPYQATINLERLAADGFTGRFGFYEAIDYTPARVPRGQSFALIQSFMAHHQGMSLLSLAHLLEDQTHAKRFEGEPRFQATLLLLQERIPKATIPYTHTSEEDEVTLPVNNTEMRIMDTPHTSIPAIQLLSNGKYNVMVTNAGGGYSQWRDIAVTRWREDTTRDNWGTFCYIRDMETGAFWSNTYQPTAVEPRKYEATFTQGRAEFRREDHHIETHTEMVVSPEDDIELRRVRLKNRSRRPRVIELTTYAEVVLNVQAADTSHPAFSNLFVQTEIREEQNAIVCTRRPRMANEQVPWMCHIVKAHGIAHDGVSYETDRMKFLGRRNSVAAPQAMMDEGPLSGSQGSVLDPIVATRYRVRLEPGQSATFDMITGVSDTKEGCQALIDKYQDKHLTERVLELSWTHSQVILRQINATEADAQLYSRLASSVLFVNPLLRGDAGVVVNNTKGQSGLWSYSISGDLPIVLLRVQDPNNMVLVKQLIQAHAYWRLKGLQVDLVIWNEDRAGYRQNLLDQISGLIAAGISVNFTDRPGGIFVRSAEQISNEDRILFLTVARVVICDDRGTLEDQLNRRAGAKLPIPLVEQTISELPRVKGLAPRKDLLFFNGTGGFSQDGKEYVINTSSESRTPAPWVNVIANPDFGTVVSEAGSAYTWVENAHEYRLTPWHNDPVNDATGEAFYLRDEDTGQFWSPTPLPRVGRSPYITRHGFGYSVFESMEDGIACEATVYVDVEASVKFIALKIKNKSGRLRKLSATGYMELVLGDIRSKSVMHIVTELDAATGALVARNNYNTIFQGRVAFLDTDDINRTFTTDRTEFIGRNGSQLNPEAMRRVRLSGKAGGIGDPCFAIQVPFDLYEDQEKEIVFRLGSARSTREAVQLAQRFKGALASAEALMKVHAYWEEAIGAIQVESPDKSMDLLVNGWLTYQTLACRVWARSGFYQSGGAFGFRDQLQDIMSLIHVKPGIARAQIILCASRQFREGDVQHWWHPPAGRGVRTKCSDDYLWLPFATARYVTNTGDKDILSEDIAYLEGRLLNAGEESYYDLPVRGDAHGSLYEHCTAAILNGLVFGERGLPLMGAGDWNDGMDKVGEHGKGESVWLAFFLYDVLTRFSYIAELHGDKAFAEKCVSEATKLQANIEANAWDGEWYRRAYFDNGVPLGSAANVECRIDSISQSWSVLSGAGSKERAEAGMRAVDKFLVRRDNGIIQLLDPPFDKSDLNPGYIKGYVPGVRENGGQYTHAAIWTVMAFAVLGQNEKVWELFSMINPINHGTDDDMVNTYKVEPYVVAADVYGVDPHKGRGGWTWYTGSAGWMNHFIIGSLLGIHVHSGKLILTPCLPPGWDRVSIRYRYKSAMYVINITMGAGRKHILLDGQVVDESDISLADDGKTHTVELALP